MNVIPRSQWTAQVPKQGTVGDDYEGLPYFTETPREVNFYSIQSSLVYVHRNPADILNQLLKETLASHYSDLNYNYAISQNTHGIYVVRGSKNKSSGSNNIKVLLIKGEREEPTDQMKVNQRLFEQPVGTFLPKPILTVNTTSVHVFDLIEYLAQKGYYTGRNDGTFGPFTEQAIYKMQVDLGHKDPNGIFDHWTYANAQRR